MLKAFKFCNADVVVAALGLRLGGALIVGLLLSTVIPLSQAGSPANTRRAARSSNGSVTDCGANGRAFQGCVRFRSLENLALDVVGRTVTRVSVEEHTGNYRAARAKLKKKSA
jgi:hypothetical protein